MNSTLTAAVHPAETLSLVVFLPLHLLLPCLPSLTIRGKMAVGFVIAILPCPSLYSWSTSSPVCHLCGDSCESLYLVSYSPSQRSLFSSQVSSFYLVKYPCDVMTFPIDRSTQLEFVYAQSPENMRGMLTGLLYFTLGIFSGGSSVTYLLSHTSSRYFIFCIILLVFCVVWFVE